MIIIGSLYQKTFIKDYQSSSSFNIQIFSLCQKKIFSVVFITHTLW